MTLTDPKWACALWDELQQAPRQVAGAVVLAHDGHAPDLETALDAPISVAAQAAVEALCRHFGPIHDLVADCPGCGVRLETTLDLTPLRSTTPLPTAPEATEPALAGQEAAPTLRVPTSRDLLLAAAHQDPREWLVRRCIGAGDSGAGDVSQLEGRLDQLLGPAALTASLTCPECGHVCSPDLDVVALLVERVEAVTQGWTAQVAVLARAFGWSEADVAAVPSSRRGFYLAHALAGTS